VHRFLIQILPSAVVAPLYFQGKIDFGVINQSSSAFNHILSDVSLVVYQVRRCCRRMRFDAALQDMHLQDLSSKPCSSDPAASQLESLASFSAVIDRLGEFEEVINAPKAAQAVAAQPGSLKSAVDPTSSSVSDDTAASQHDTSAADSLQQPVTGKNVKALADSELIRIVDEPVASGSANGTGGDLLLELAGVTLRTPDGSATLVQNLDVQVINIFACVHLFICPYIPL
jgi:hypothetical protein